MSMTMHVNIVSAENEIYSGTVTQVFAPAEMGEVAQGSLHYNVLFGIGIVLFVVTSGINLLATRLVGGRGKRRPGGRL